MIFAKNWLPINCSYGTVIRLGSSTRHPFFIVLNIGIKNLRLCQKKSSNFFFGIATNSSGPAIHVGSTWHLYLLPENFAVKIYYFVKQKITTFILVFLHVPEEQTLTLGGHSLIIITAKIYNKKLRYRQTKIITFSSAFLHVPSEHFMGNTWLKKYLSFRRNGL